MYSIYLQLPIIIYVLYIPTITSIYKILYLHKTTNYIYKRYSIYIKLHTYSIYLQNLLYFNTILYSLTTLVLFHLKMPPSFDFSFSLLLLSISVYFTLSSAVILHSILTIWRAKPRMEKKIERGCE